MKNAKVTLLFTVEGTCIRAVKQQTRSTTSEIDLKFRILSIVQYQIKSPCLWSKFPALIKLYIIQLQYCLVSIHTILQLGWHGLV